MTEACNGLYQVSSELTADRFGLHTIVEALYVDEMQEMLVELEGSDNYVLSIILGA